MLNEEPGMLSSNNAPSMLMDRSRGMGFPIPDEPSVISMGRALQAADLRDIAAEEDSSRMLKQQLQASQHLRIERELLEGEIKALREENAALREARNDLTLSAAKLRKAEERGDLLEHTLRAKAMECERLAEQLKENTRAVSQLQEELGVERERRARAERGLLDENQRNEAVRRETAELRNNLSLSNQQLQDMRDELKDTQRELKSTKDELSKYERATSGQAMDLSSLRSDRALLEARLKEALAQLEVAQAEASKSVVLRAELSDKDKLVFELSSLKRKAEAQEKEATKLERLASELSQEVDNRNAQIMAMERVAQENEASCRQVVQFFADLRKNNYRLQGMATGLGGEPLHSWGKTLGGAWGSIKALLDTLLEANVRSGELEKELEEQRKAESALRQEKQGLSQHLQQVSHAYQSEESSKVAAKKQLEEFSSLMEEYRESLTEYEPFLALLRNTLKRISPADLPGIEAHQVELERKWSPQFAEVLAGVKSLVNFFGEWKRESGNLLVQIRTKDAALERHGLEADEKMRKLKEEYQAILREAQENFEAQLAVEKDKKRQIKAKYLEILEAQNQLQAEMNDSEAQATKYISIAAETACKESEWKEKFCSCVWLVQLLARAIIPLSSFHEELRQQKAFLAIEYRRSQKLKEGVNTLYEAAVADSEELGMQLEESVFVKATRRRPNLRAVVIVIIAGNRILRFHRQALKKGLNARTWGSEVATIPISPETFFEDPTETFTEMVLPPLSELSKSDARRALSALLGIFLRPSKEKDNQWSERYLDRAPLMSVLERGQRRHWKTLQERGIFESPPIQHLNISTTSLNQTYAAQRMQQGLNFTGSHHTGMDQIAAIRTAMVTLSRNANIYMESLKEMEERQQENDFIEGRQLEERNIFEQKIAGLSDKLSTLAEQINEEQLQKQILREQFDDQILQLQDNLEKEQAEVARLQKETMRQSKELSSLKEDKKQEMEKVIEQLEDFSSERNQLQEQIQKAENALRLEKTKQCASCHQLRQELRNALDECFKKSLDVESNEYRIAEIRKSVEEIQEQSDQRLNEIDRLRSAMSKLQRDKAIACENYDKILKENSLAFAELDRIRHLSSVDTRDYFVQKPLLVREQLRPADEWQRKEALSQRMAAPDVSMTLTRDQDRYHNKDALRKGIPDLPMHLTRDQDRYQQATDPLSRDQDRYQQATDHKSRDQDRYQQSADPLSRDHDRFQLATDALSRDHDRYQQAVDPLRTGIPDLTPHRSRDQDRYQQTKEPFRSAVPELAAHLPREQDRFQKTADPLSHRTAVPDLIAQLPREQERFQQTIDSFSGHRTGVPELIAQLPREQDKLQQTLDSLRKSSSGKEPIAFQPLSSSPARFRPSNV